MVLVLHYVAPTTSLAFLWSFLFLFSRRKLSVCLSALLAYKAKLSSEDSVRRLKVMFTKLRNMADIK